jgi:type I restriction enzyme, S subunit
MEGWRETPILEVCDAYQPKTIGRKEMDPSGPFPVYGANGVIGRYHSYNHEESEVLLGCRGTCGVVNVSEPRSWITGNAMVVRPKGQDLHPELLRYFLEGAANFDGVITGAAQPQITRKSLSQLTISFPVTLREQERIVAILDEAFAAIATATANAEKNLANARELFEDCQAHEFTSNGKGRPLTRLGDACSKFEYGSSAKSQAEGTAPVLRMGNMQEGEIDWEDLVYSSNETEIAKYLLRPNDVLFNRTNSAAHVGKTAIYRGEHEALFAGYLIRIHWNPDCLDPEYLNFFLNSRPARDYGKTVMSQSVNQANINASKLREYAIPLPSLDDQRTVVDRLSVLRKATIKLAGIHRQKLAHLTNLKQSLLHKAFTGELTADSKAADRSLSEANV